MQLRRATSADTDAILALWKIAAAPGITDTREDVLRITATERVAFILAIADGAVVGSIIAAFDGWRGNMYRVATHPDYRRRGIARSLVAEAERAFDAWGVKRITALVETDRPWAIHFWKAVGYDLDERVARYVRDPQPLGARGR